MSARTGKMLATTSSQYPAVPVQEAGAAQIGARTIETQRTVRPRMTSASPRHVAGGQQAGGRRVRPYAGGLDVHIEDLAGAGDRGAEGILGVDRVGDVADEGDEISPARSRAGTLGGPGIAHAAAPATATRTRRARGRACCRRCPAR